MTWCVGFKCMVVWCLIWRLILAPILTQLPASMYMLLERKDGMSELKELSP
jgi:hypothetical protein